MRGPYFDDLVLGQEFLSGRRFITEADVVLFTSLCGLHSPLFNDEEVARKNGYKGKIVPGPLILAYSVGLTEELTHETALAALGFDKLRFLSPLYQGDALAVRSTIKVLRASSSRPNTGIVTMHHSVVTADGALAAEYDRTLLYGSREYFSTISNTISHTAQV
jgi:itaconyl-CoA hydratase